MSHDEFANIVNETITQAERLDTSWKSDPAEPYALRRFNFNRSKETQRYKDMDRHMESLQFMQPSKPSSNEDLDWLLRANEADRKLPWLLWAIVDDRNEPVGWVQFYVDVSMNTENRQKLGLKEDDLVLEVSYSKLFPTWPKYSHHIKDRDDLDTTERKGVAVNGLKQSLIKLKQMEETISTASGEAPRRVLITAYTSPENKASEAVLSRNGFEIAGSQQYKKGEEHEDRLWIKQI